jgi:hypothetical protein
MPRWSFSAAGAIASEADRTFAPARFRRRSHEAMSFPKGRDMADTTAIAKFRIPTARAAAAACFEDLNREIFGGALALDFLIGMKAPSGAWGACTGAIDQISGDPLVARVDLSPTLFSSDLSPPEQHQALRTVLGHEMVHVWQWQVDGPERLASGLMPAIRHGPNFHSWRPLFAASGIMLKSGYSWRDLFGERAEDLFRESALARSCQAKNEAGVRMKRVA